MEVDPAVDVDVSRVADNRVPPVGGVRQGLGEGGEVGREVELGLALRQFDLAFLGIHERNRGARARQAAVAGVQPVHLEEVAARDRGGREMLGFELVDVDPVGADL